MFLFVLFAMAGCAGRPGSDVLRTVPAVDDDTRIVEIHAISTRGRTDPQLNVFTSERSAEVNYARFAISIPPNHRPGNIEWPDGNIDPSTDFAVVDQHVTTRASFVGRLGEARDGANVVVFIHGYNTNFPEALFRIAQLAADAGTEDIPVLFSWPSEGAVTGYVADRDSAAFSRDALAATLTELAEDRRFGSITVFAHSLGGWLAMEALRQMRLTGENAALDRLTVILAAPDIDVDLFKRQLAVLKPLHEPMTVLVSPDDQALRFSMGLGGTNERVGLLDVESPEVRELARENGIAVVDISDVSASDPLNHGRYAALAALVGSTEGETTPARGVRNAGAFVFNAVGATLSSPFDLVGRALAGE